MKKEDVRKWEFSIISDTTDEIFKEFNEIYSRNREYARYYINSDANNGLASRRLLVYKHDNIQIINEELIKYGVSISLKRYKSTKKLYSFWFDTKSGNISKLRNGKFIQCKPNELPSCISEYIVSQKKWMKFIFDLDLPVTFNTIVTKKLYSERKLLRWYYGCDYKIALSIKKLDCNLSYLIKKHGKYIRNLDNINKEIFNKKSNYLSLFIQTFKNSIKTMKVMNASWSYKRLLNENNKIKKHIYNVYLENIKDEELELDDYFKPIILFLKSRGIQHIKTKKELLLNCKSADQFDNVVNFYKPIFFKKDNYIFYMQRNKFSIGRSMRNIQVQDINSDINVYEDNKNLIDYIDENYNELEKQYKRRLKFNNIMNKNKLIEEINI